MLQNPFENLENGTVFNIYFMAISRGFQTNYRQLRFLYRYEEVNEIPVFQGKPDNLELVVYEKD